MAEKKVSKELQNKLEQLQLMQQQLQVFAAQKQQFQLKEMEIDNALKEIEDAKGKTYKLIGDVLIEQDKKKIKGDLEGEKNKMTLRIGAIEKQEKSIHSKALDLQKEISQDLK